MATRVLGIPKASLGNWVRLVAKGALGSAGGDDKGAKVSPEQMAIARLRAKKAWLRPVPIRTVITANQALRRWSREKCDEPLGLGPQQA